MTRIPINAAMRQRIREASRHRCGYYQSQQRYLLIRLTIEHIAPRSKFAPNDPKMHAEENLWLACQSCNGYKGNKTHEVDPVSGELSSIFNPRTQEWHEHFKWSDDGLRVVGLTPTGRATVGALRLDTDPEALNVRANWVSVGWHPPKD